MSHDLDVSAFLDPQRPSRKEARKARKARKEAKTGAIASPLQPKNFHQRHYIEHLRRGDSAFGVGPAGTGKTYIPARIAARQLIEGKIGKIVVARVTVAPKKHALGFLPGKLEQKLEPWLVPVFDGFKAEMSNATLDKLRQENRIEIVAFEHMRGRTFADCFVILDESQNASFADLKLFLTRIGENCQVAVTGDLDQIDILDSGLFQVLRLAEDYDVPMAIVRFDEKDVVRSAFTKAWVAAFAGKKEQDSEILDQVPAFLHNPPTVTK